MSLVFVACCVGSGLCRVLITCLWCPILCMRVCVCVCVCVVSVIRCNKNTLHL